jgi:glycosidase
MFNKQDSNTKKEWMDNQGPFKPQDYVRLTHPEWSKNATIYEVNIRQYTPEGTFKAFTRHLPRLKDMGIDILWLMPIHPIGEKNRKGSLGSYYSVKDYYGINPEFGTLDDFKDLVRNIHALDMFVIIDWVANHSAWDNPLVDEHPEWYSRTPEGGFRPTPWYDWDDIIDFSFDVPGIRQYMTEAMKYWVKETDIDGFRCDVAGFVPLDFWENLRTALDRIKPVFMLAEWESRDLHRKAFDMTYAWSLWDKMQAVAKDPGKLPVLIEYIAHDVNTFPRNAYRMTFTDNHDKNSWEGNPVSNFGNGLEAFMVFAGVLNGMPMVYSGQEAGLDRSLAFFDKDLIEWKEHSNADLYKTLFDLKHRNQALWNGKHGGEMIRIKNDHPDRIISFYREMNGDKVIAIFNFSDQEVRVQPDSIHHAGTYHNIFGEVSVNFTGHDLVTLKPWGYLILEMTS